jgi:hypothetical protein
MVSAVVDRRERSRWGRLETHVNVEVGAFPIFN